MSPNTLRSRSGNQQSEDPLVRFLYLLMGEIHPHKIESFMSKLPTDSPCHLFGNGFLAQYAEDVAARLVPKVEVPAEDFIKDLDRARRDISERYAKLACAMAPSIRRRLDAAGFDGSKVSCAGMGSVQGVKVFGVGEGRNTGLMSTSPRSAIPA